MQKELKTRPKNEGTWACTLFTQLSLCIAVYIALSIGQPQKLTNGKISSKGRAMDTYFISVDGGFRSLEEETLLLQQMAKAQKIYEARFVISISELGESSPLLQNAMAFHELGSIPWYTSGSSRERIETNLSMKIEIPYGTMDIIQLYSLSEMFSDHSSRSANDLIQWLTNILKESNGEWKIVFGDCNILKTEKGSFFERLLNILLQYRVDAYISMKTCAARAQGGGGGSFGTSPMEGGPYLASINQNFISKEQKADGFFLHRVSSLEMDTFAVRLTGEVEHKLSFEKWGRATM